LKLGFSNLDCHLQLDPIIRRVDQILLGAEVPLRRLDRRVPEQQLDLLQLPARCPAQLRARAPGIVGAIPGTPAASAYRRRNWPETSSPRFTERKTKPSVKPATNVQASIATFAQVGIGIVRTRPCLPTSSTMHQRLSRCCMCLSVSAPTSDRRSPQLRSTARIAWVAAPLVGRGIRRVKQRLCLPDREPVPKADARLRDRLGVSARTPVKANHSVSVMR
jgi:hypothetical protein